MVLGREREEGEHGLDDEDGELFVDFEERGGERVAADEVFGGVFGREEGSDVGPEGAERVEVGGVGAEDLDGGGEHVDGLHGEGMVVGLRDAIDVLMENGIGGLGRRGLLE